MEMLRLLGALGWRNLWRNHRRTWITFTAITIGVWSMITLASWSQVTNGKSLWPTATLRPMILSLG